MIAGIIIAAVVAAAVVADLVVDLAEEEAVVAAVEPVAISNMTGREGDGRETRPYDHGGYNEAQEIYPRYLP